MMSEENKYRTTTIHNKLRDIITSHEAIIEKIAALGLELDEQNDHQLQQVMEKIHISISENLQELQKFSDHNYFTSEATNNNNLI